MTETASPPPDAALRPGLPPLPRRLVGVVVSPEDTFTRIVAQPRWFGALAAITLTLACLSLVMLSTETGQLALLDQQVRQIQSFGGTITDEQYAAMERMLPYTPYLMAGSQLVMVPLVTLALAGVLFGIFNAGLGGNATFRQVLAVVAHSGAISLVQQLFLAPLVYARGSLSVGTNLGVFVQGFLNETSFAARFLGMIDLFVIWWLIVLAIGLGRLYRRRTRPIAGVLLAVYGVVAVVVALFMSLSGGA